MEEEVFEAVQSCMEAGRRVGRKLDEGQDAFSRIAEGEMQKAFLDLLDAQREHLDRLMRALARIET